MKTIFAFLLFITFSTTSFSQDNVAYANDVKKCIKSNGTIEYYADVVDQMYAMLQKQFAAKEVPTYVWNEVKKGKKEAMADLATMIVSAYKGHFSHQDVKNMNALYTTEAGKNMFKKEALSEGDKIVLNTFYESDTGQKIIGSQDSMNESLSKIAEVWSSDLYQSAITLLSTKGFDL